MCVNKYFIILLFSFCYSSFAEDPVYEIEDNTYYDMSNQTQSPCVDVHKVPIEMQCQFVLSTPNCDINPGLIHYHKLLFCTRSNYNSLYGLMIAVLVILTIIIFIFLGVTAEDFLCPTLAVLAKMLHLSEHLAGVTLLAFGNGIPDVFASMSNASGTTEMMINELYGSGIFNITIIFGLICLQHPFRLRQISFFRDSMYLLFTIIWINWCQKDNIIKLWEALSFICIYVIYLASCIIHHCIDKRKIHSQDGQKDNPKVQETQTPKKNNEEEVQSSTRTSKLLSYIIVPKFLVFVYPTIKRRFYDTLMNVDIALHHGMNSYYQHDSELAQRLELQQQKDNLVNRPQSLVGEVLFELVQFDKNDWKRSTIWHRLAAVLIAPSVLILKLLIPIVNTTSFNNGWCKLLNVWHSFIFPSIFSVLLGYHQFTIRGFPGWVVFLIIGICLALIVAVTSNRTYPPPYHKVFAIVGLLESVAIIRYFANEIVSCAHCYGTIFAVNESFVGLTLMAWGNSIGDIFTNIAVANYGLERIAFSACYGSVLFGMSFGNISRMVTSNKMETKVNIGVNGPYCSFFFFYILLSSIVLINLFNCEARRSVGIFLIILYLFFITTSILVVLNLIPAFP